MKYVIVHKKKSELILRTHDKFQNTQRTQLRPMENPCQKTHSWSKSTNPKLAALGMMCLLDLIYFILEIIYNMNFYEIRWGVVASNLLSIPLAISTPLLTKTDCGT